MNTPSKLLLAFAPALLMAACGGGDDSLDDRLNVADPKVRLVHAVPFGPNVSLFRNDIAQAGDVTNLPYKGASRYFDVPVQSQRWDVRSTNAPVTTIGSAAFDAQRGNKYTLIAVPDSGSLTAVALIEDPFNKSIASDNARLRMFNAAFNAGSVDVYLTAPAADIGVATPTFSAVRYKQANPVSGADSVEVEGGVYRLRLTSAGTKNVIFNTTLDLAKNADWLLTSVPGSVTPNDVKVLVVKSDEGAPATELSTTP